MFDQGVVGQLRAPRSGVIEPVGRRRTLQGSVARLLFPRSNNAIPDDAIRLFPGMVIKNRIEGAFPFPAVVFPKHHHLIPQHVEVFEEIRLRRWNVLGNRSVAVGMTVTVRHQADAGGHTFGKRGEMSQERDRLRRKHVDVWCAYVCLPGIPDTVAAQFVRTEDNNVVAIHTCQLSHDMVR